MIMTNEKMTRSGGQGAIALAIALLVGSAPALAQQDNNPQADKPAAANGNGAAGRAGRCQHDRLARESAELAGARSTDLPQAPE